MQEWKIRAGQILFRSIMRRNRSCLLSGRFKREFEVMVKNHANIHSMDFCVLSCLLLADGKHSGVRAAKQKHDKE
jgi:hypothetical protein